MIPAREPEINSDIQHYRLERQIGAGGMGTVWAARDMRTGDARALKILRPSAGDASTTRARLLREAHAARSIRHPAIVPVIDVLEHQGNPVLVMELLHGETLRERLLREERLSAEVAIALLLPIAEALGAAHALGIVHRDLKPENVFIEHSGSARLLDFGVARFYEPPEGSASAPLTGVGVLLGTLSYMAPEQALRPSECDQRVDVWALGVILYEVLSGVRPIEGATGPETMRKLLVGGITPLEVLVPGLPRPLLDLVGAMLARSPEKRPQSAELVAGLLRP